MRQYRIRPYSPIWWLLTITALTAFMLFMNLPSTIEGVI